MGTTSARNRARRLGPAHLCAASPAETQWCAGGGDADACLGVKGSPVQIRPSRLVFRTLVARIGNETRHDRSHLALAARAHHPPRRPCRRRPRCPDRGDPAPSTIARTDPRQPAQRQQRPGPRRPAPAAGRAAETSPPLTGPAPSGPAAPDPHQPGRRRGQPVPHQHPDVHRAAQPRTRQLDAVIPARLPRAMTAAAPEVATPPGTTRPAARQANHAQPRRSRRPAGTLPGRREPQHRLPSLAGTPHRPQAHSGSRMRGTADRCP